MKKKCIIVDIDGTLSSPNGRDIYDVSRVIDDHCNVSIVHIVRTYNEVHPDVDVIIMTGRPQSCQADTEKWLREKAGIIYSKLYMRSEGSDAADYIYKYYMYKDEIEPKYDVLFVLEDRARVVAMWRDLGLTCLQVKNGNY